MAKIGVREAKNGLPEGLFDREFGYKTTKDITTKRGEALSETWLYHDANFQADRRHRRRDICPTTKKQTYSR